MRVRRIQLLVLLVHSFVTVAACSPILAAEFNRGPSNEVVMLFLTTTDSTEKR